MAGRTTVWVRAGAAIAAVSVAAVGLVGWGGSAGAATATKYNYVALGDSYTSSTGFNAVPDVTYAPLGCFQSQTDYPHQVANILKTQGRLASFADGSCGGATTVDFTKAQKTTVGTNDPQFARITKKTNLVTIGIGGNDAGLVSLATECVEDVLTFASCKADNVKDGVDKESAAINAAEPKIEAAIKGVRARAAKGVRILLVNYLEAVPDNGKGCYPFIPLPASDMAWFTSKFKQLNAMLATAAAKQKAQLVNTYTPTIGHNACASPTTRYVEFVGVLSLNPLLSLAAPLHPNIAGADAQTAIVASAIG